MTKNLIEVLIALAALNLIALSVRAWLLRRIKKEVQSTKKVPTTICDKGHIYPSESSLHIEVPEMPEKVELCPFCYDINMRNAAQAALAESRKSNVTSIS